jgi:hypothetical protein
MNKKRWLSILLTLLVALALAGVVQADVVFQNDVTGSNNPIQLIPGDSNSSFTVEFRVVAAQNDGDPQCNIDKGETFSFRINTPPGIVADPAVLEYSGCGYDIAVEFSANADAQPGAITFSVITYPAGGGSFTFNQAEFSISIKDVTPPQITPVVAGTIGIYPWYVSNVRVEWQIVDAQSAILSMSGCETLDIITDTIYTGRDLTCTATSGGGTGFAHVNIRRDATPPVVTLVGGPEEGSSHYFAFVPPAPTYEAYDNLSGLAGDCCSIDGYSDLVGDHVVTANAMDQAGNKAADSNAYAVLPWEKVGFAMPVDMGIWNVARVNTGVPFKFELFAGPHGELTELWVMKYYYALPISCDTLPIETVDDIEYTMEVTGETELRYSTAEGRYLYNWLTPNLKGACYKAIVVFQDGERLSAYFKLR